MSKVIVLPLHVLFPTARRVTMLPWVAGFAPFQALVTEQGTGVGVTVGVGVGVDVGVAPGAQVTLLGEFGNNGLPPEGPILMA